MKEKEGYFEESHSEWLPPAVLGKLFPVNDLWSFSYRACDRGESSTFHKDHNPHTLNSESASRLLAQLNSHHRSNRMYLLRWAYFGWVCFQGN